MSLPRFFGLLLGVSGRMLWRRALGVREQSWLMLSVIGAFVLAYGVGGFCSFYWGFDHLARFPGLGSVLVERVLYVLFAFLLLMLVISNVVIGFSALYKSSETQWLLTLPVRAADVFAWKTAETIVLSSWAFLFLSAPMMLAYGVAREMPLGFYLRTALLFVPFIILPGAVGGLVVLVITRFLQRQVFKWIVISVGAACLLAGMTLLGPDLRESETLQMMETVNRLLRGSQLALEPVLPSYWMASGIVAWSDGPAWKGHFFLALLISNALMAGYVCVLLSRWLFYEGWSRTHTHQAFVSAAAGCQRPASTTGFGLLERLLAWVPGVRPWTRALIAKDIRVFWRDTTQWSQFVIFFGLLGLYVTNLRPSTFGSQIWTMFVAFLSLGATALTAATLTTRFVYPQFSLEGRRLWIVGLAPCGLRHVLYEKFWLSSIFSGAVTVALMLVSAHRLQLPGWLTVLFAASAVWMSLGLSGIAVGIGALFPHFGSGASVMRRDDNPAKIVSGFGGTFCFVLSLLFILVVLGIQVGPLYFLMTGNRAPGYHGWVVVLAVWAVVSLVSILAATVPMRLALKRIAGLEI